MAHNDNLPGYALLGFGAGIYLFFKGFRELRKYRLVADTPEIPIRSMPMGLVEIHGQANGDEQVTSPVSHTPCFLYKVVIERWKTDPKGGGSWSHERTDVDGVKFRLADPTGSVLIDGQQAELDLPQMARREVGHHAGPSGGPGAADQELLQYVTKAQVHQVTGWVERGLEHVGPLHDPTKEEKRQALMGMLKGTPGSLGFQQQMMTLMGPRMKQQLESMGPQADPKQEEARQAGLEALNHPPGSPEFLEAIKRAEASGGMPESMHGLAAMFQGGGAGPVDWMGTLSAASGRYRLTEFCLVPGGSYEVTGTCTENPAPRDEHDRNMIVKGQNEPTFLISAKTKKQEEAGLRGRALKMILGGAALSIVCAAILLAKFGLL